MERLLQFDQERRVLIIAEIDSQLGCDFDQSNIVADHWIVEYSRQISSFQSSMRTFEWTQTNGEMSFLWGQSSELLNSSLCSQCN